MSLLISNPKKRGILCVDDDISVRDSMRIILLGKGYSNFHEASNGIEALSKLREIGPEIYLILLDLRMPEMDGMSFFKHLINFQDYPIGVIIITAYGSPDLSHEFYSTGTENVVPVTFVAKPFDSRGLLIDIERSMEQIYNRRLNSLDLRMRLVYDHLLNGEKKFDEFSKSLHDHLLNIEKRIDEVSKKHASFLSQLGLDLIRAIIIACAIVAILYLGLGDFLKRILSLVG